MHVTQLCVSQVLSEEVSAGLSGATLVLLRFGFWAGQFLCTFACYKDGAAIFEVCFNLAEIHLIRFLNLDVFASIVIKQ